MGQHVHPDAGDHVAAQGGREPQAFVVEAAGVEADEEQRCPEPLAQRVEVGVQVRAATLLGRLDEHQHAAVGLAAALDGLEGGHGREDGVAVVHRAPAVEAVALAHRDKRVKSLPPAPEGRLLVEVAVQQGDQPRPGAGRSRHVRDDDRSQALALDNLDGAAG